VVVIDVQHGHRERPGELAGKRRVGAPDRRHGRARDRERGRAVVAARVERDQPQVQVVELPRPRPAAGGAVGRQVAVERVVVARPLRDERRHAARRIAEQRAQRRRVPGRIVGLERGRATRGGRVARHVQLDAGFATGAVVAPSILRADLDLARASLDVRVGKLGQGGVHAVGRDRDERDLAQPGGEAPRLDRAPERGDRTVDDRHPRRGHARRDPQGRPQRVGRGLVRQRRQPRGRGAQRGAGAQLVGDQVGAHRRRGQRSIAGCGATRPRPSGWR